VGKARPRIRNRKRFWIILGALFVVVALGVGGFLAYLNHQMSRIPQMTFAQMLAYTTGSNESARITVGIIQDGQASFTVYGMNGSVLPAEEYVYEIGSITKTFTAGLLFRAIAEGNISLDDSIDQHLNLPAGRYYPTLRRLITHTSGYQGYYFERPMIGNFLARRNSFYRIDEGMLLNRIGNIRLTDRDYPFVYSNFGIAVVGAVLAEVYGMDFTTIMNQYVLENLGLENTRIITSVSGATARNANTFRANTFWDWAPGDAYLAAGGLQSTIGDMLKYAQALLEHEDTFLAQTLVPLAEIDGNSTRNIAMNIRMDRVGTAWMIDDVNHIIWHNGATDNSNSYLGIDPANQTAVVILSNLPPNYRIPATVMGANLLQTLPN
jgi:CubicO group peptidase (beta-lactamase class C family)